MVMTYLRNMHGFLTNTIPDVLHENQLSVGKRRSYSNIDMNN